MKSPSPELKARHPAGRIPHARWLGFLFLGAAVALHAAYVVHHRVNTDEPQHLHVAWAWTQGLLPYRDVFDNHAPLFSLLMAPMVRAAGERPDIVLIARLAMIPLAVLAVAMTWVVGRKLFDGDAALWGVCIAALAPDFMLGSAEYRTDQLWAAAWMIAIAVLLTGRLTRTRSFLFGLALGVALATSMKTSLLVVCLAAACAATLAIVRPRGLKPGLGWLAARVAPALGGMAVVPGLLAAFFATQGAWKPMIYCVLSHNVVPNLGFWHEGWHRALILPVALPLLWIAGRRIADSSGTPAAGARRTVLFLSAGMYYVALQGIWPLVTRQDALPLLPMAAVLFAPFLLGLSARAGRWWSDRPHLVRGWVLVPVMVLAAEIAWTQRIEPVWQHNDTDHEISFMRAVLRLTRPGDTVMDLKGETIFRRRPFYYALESITAARIAAGSIPDDIGERLIASHTPVAVADTPEFPARGRAFMNANYVPAGKLRVVGKALGSEDGPDGGRFEIRVPQRYAVVCEGGTAAGLLDETPYRGPRELVPGWHRYRRLPREGRTTVLWAEAVTRVDPRLP